MLGAAGENDLLPSLHASWIDMILTAEEGQHWAKLLVCIKVIQAERNF